MKLADLTPRVVLLLDMQQANEPYRVDSWLAHEDAVLLPHLLKRARGLALLLSDQLPGRSMGAIRMRLLELRKRVGSAVTMRRPRWNDVADMRLLELKKCGLDFSQIAFELNRSAGSVQARWYWLGGAKK